VSVRLMTHGKVPPSPKEESMRSVSFEDGFRLPHGGVRGFRCLGYPRVT